MCHWYHVKPTLTRNPSDPAGDLGPVRSPDEARYLLFYTISKIVVSFCIYDKMHKTVQESTRIPWEVQEGRREQVDSFYPDRIEVDDSASSVALASLDVL